MTDESRLGEMYEKAGKKNPPLTIDDYRKVFGSRYRKMLAEVEDVPGNLREPVHGYKRQSYEIAGFLSHQCWNRGTRKEFAEEHDQSHQGHA